MKLDTYEERLEAVKTDRCVFGFVPHQIHEQMLKNLGA